MKTLEQLLDEHTAPGRFVDRLEDGAVRCWACAHRCLIKPGRRGICGVRFNRDGELRVPWGYVAGAQVVPLSSSEECCGFGGLFAVKHAAISEAMLARKIANINETRPDLLVTGDASCMTQIAGGLSRDGSPVRAAAVL